MRKEDEQWMRSASSNRKSFTRQLDRERKNWMFIWRASDRRLSKVVCCPYTIRHGGKLIASLDGLTKLFTEVRRKDKLADLDIQYRKFAEWLRIEVAATIYHLFLAEDNSAELFAQGKRIHSLIPYTVLKNIIRVANPAAVMNGVLDLFLATPFKARSLMQRVLSMAISDGIKHLQENVDVLITKIDDPVLCDKLKLFVDADDEIKDEIRRQAAEQDTDLVVVILQSDILLPELEPPQIEKMFNAYVAYVSTVDNVSSCAYEDSPRKVD
jgi:hypothetical protein